MTTTMTTTKKTADLSCSTSRRRASVGGQGVFLVRAYLEEAHQHEDERVAADATCPYFVEIELQQVLLEHVNEILQRRVDFQVMLEERRMCSSAVRPSNLRTRIS